MPGPKEVPDANLKSKSDLHHCLLPSCFAMRKKGRGSSSAAAKEVQIEYAKNDLPKVFCLPLRPNAKKGA